MASTADPAPLEVPLDHTSAGEDSSHALTLQAERAVERGRIIQRLLETVPGIVTWGCIVGSIALSFRFPAVVAWFVLTFDVYWLYKTVMLTGSVTAAYSMIRRTVAVDWRTRTYALRDIPGRIAAIEDRSAVIRERVDTLAAAAQACHELYHAVSRWPVFRKRRGLCTYHHRGSRNAGCCQQYSAICLR